MLEKAIAEAARNQEQEKAAQEREQNRQQREIQKRKAAILGQSIAERLEMILDVRVPVFRTKRYANQFRLDELERLPRPDNKLLVGLDADDFEVHDAPDGYDRDACEKARAICIAYREIRNTYLDRKEFAKDDASALSRSATVSTADYGFLSYEKNPESVALDDEDDHDFKWRKRRYFEARLARIGAAPDVQSPLVRFRDAYLRYAQRKWDTEAHHPSNEMISDREIRRFIHARILPVGSDAMQRIIINDDGISCIQWDFTF